MKRIVALVLVVAAVAGWWFFLRRDPSAAGKVRYRTAKVDRGQVIEGVAASGTVQPVELIQVGTQVSGVIQELRVDFNSKVTAKQVIALLDARRLQSQVDQDLAAVARAKADLKRLEAGVEQAKADVARVQSSVVQAASDVNRVKEQLVQARTDVDRADALLLQAKTELERQRQLVEKRLTSQSDLDAATANAGSLAAQQASALAAVRQTEAQVATAEAAVKQAEAQVAVSEAALRQSESQLPVGRRAITLAEAQLAGDRVNLEYATIVSPVDGVVVSRNVDVGQTVAASLSAPTLFVIAKDLTKVQVQNERPRGRHRPRACEAARELHRRRLSERTFPGRR
jgi:HlyD family secretion protein